MINPCQRNIFDVFHIDKSETDIRKIRAEIRVARDKLKYNQAIVGRDGNEVQITESELNSMEEILLDPVKRLKAEEFVHQAHSFSSNSALTSCLKRLDSGDDPMREVFSDIRVALIVTLSGYLPSLGFSSLADDLPWPDVPGGCDLVVEPPDILREE